jgi:hypothetical protein
MKMKEILIAFIVLLSVAACQTAPVPAPAAPAPEPPKRTDAEVTFTAGPAEADVYVDGRAMGRTPLTLELSSGTHTVEFRAKGFSDTVKTVDVAPGVPITVTADMVPIKEPVSRVRVSTMPAGARVLVKETGRTVKGGESIDLAAGQYTFVAKAQGYEDTAVQVAVDGRRDQDVAIDMGQGFARVRVRAEPKGARVFANGKPLGEAPLAARLPEGKHTVSAEKEGYEPVQKDVFVEPGKTMEITLSLTRKPTHGTVRITTQPEDAAVYFKGEAVGAAPVVLENIPFDKYRARAVKAISPVLRLTGEAAVDLKNVGPVNVTLRCDRAERLYEGAWLPEKEALSREAARYAQQKVENPVTVKVAADDAVREEIGALAAPAAFFHGIMRAGDRIVFTGERREWVLWKRNASVTKDFQMAVDALLKEKKMDLPWKDAAAGAREVAASGGGLTEAVAFSLHRARSDAPLLRLEDGQMENGGETISRCRADGPITILSHGAKGLRVNGAQTKVYEDIHMARLAEGGDAVSVSWKAPPKRLLAVCDRDLGLGSPARGASLRAREKKIVSLVEKESVEALVRLSSGPGYEKKWERRVMKAASPLAGQIDLRRDEIGPHETPGRYERAWIVRFRCGDGLTQRQLHTAYTVGTEIKDFGSDQFLRRNDLDQSAPKTPETE